MLKCALPVTAGPKEKLAKLRLRESDSSPAALLLAGQLLRGDVSGSAILVGVLDLGPQGPRLFRLAGCGIHVGQVKLRHAGWNRIRRLGDQGVVEIDGLGVAAV